MEIDQTEEIDPAKNWTIQNDKGGYFRKGGPYHRGQIDAANSRARSPHYLNGRARIGYHAGFNDWLLDEREGGAA